MALDQAFGFEAVQPPPGAFPVHAQTIDTGENFIPIATLGGVSGEQGACDLAS
ncbi:hypothetical protein [Streptomyces werraensis]|uniref:hypothetical protein n=1 Tax=Streptomyces werraensis TaxID=68284 RepID=UPI0037FF8406